MANQALDSVYTAAAKELGLSGADWRRVRAALRTGEEKLNDRQRTVINKLRRLRHSLFRAWDLKEALRDLYRVVPAEHAADYLGAWIARAKRSRLRPIVILAGRVQRNFDGILAAVEHGLSNSRVEGTNAKIRLIQRRGWGYRSAESLIAMTYLCCGGLVVHLPTER